MYFFRRENAAITDAIGGANFTEHNNVQDVLATLVSSATDGWEPATSAFIALSHIAVQHDICLEDDTYPKRLLLVRHQQLPL